jgi:hypothetical protein
MSRPTAASIAATWSRWLVRPGPVSRSLTSGEVPLVRAATTTAPMSFSWTGAVMASGW